MAQMATPLPASFGLAKPTATKAMPKFITATQNWFASLSMGKSMGKLSMGKPKIASSDQTVQLPAGLQTTTLEKKAWNPSTTQFYVPTIAQIKLKGQQTSRDLKSWWGEASTQAFETKLVKQWWYDITHNRVASLLLIVFFAFFVTALFSPMRTRKK